TGTCKSLTINSGSLTLSNSGATLDLFGSFTNSATFTQNGGTFKFSDGGTSSTQTISSTSSLGTVTVNKTGGGTLRTSGTITIAGLSISGSASTEFGVPSGSTLSLTNGLTNSVSGFTFNLQGGGTLKFPSGQGVSFSAGTFKVSGTN